MRRLLCLTVLAMILTAQSGCGGGGESAGPGNAPTPETMPDPKSMDDATK